MFQLETSCSNTFKFSRRKTDSYTSGETVRINCIILLGLFSSSFAVAETTVQYTSCVDVTMVNVLTDLQKSFIQTSSNPENEKLKLYTQFYSAKYSTTKAACQQQAVNQQANDRAAAAQAFQTAKANGSTSGGSATSTDTMAAVNAGLGAYVALKDKLGPTKPKATQPVGSTSSPTSSPISPSSVWSNVDSKPAISNSNSIDNPSAIVSDGTPTNSVNNISSSESDGIAKNGVNKPSAEIQDSSEVASLQSPDPSAKPLNLKSELDAKANAVGTDIPQAGSEATKVANSPDSIDSVKAESTAITEAAQAQDAVMRKKLETAQSSAESIRYHTATKEEFRTLLTELSTYLKTGKPTCVKAAEKADMLCLESPGVSNIKTMMDVAGPVIATINAASKSCSTLNKLTSLAGTGMTVARGVCVASKFMCDTSCATSVKSITSMQAQFKKLQSQFNVESRNLATGCSVPKPDPTCPDQKIEMSNLVTAINTFSSALPPEAAPSPGTSKFLAEKCSGYAKEVAQMGISILGLAKASSNAADCEKKLSTSAAGSVVTTQEYCSTPANASTDTCKCQRDSTATGCANALASNVNNINDGQGSNIKTSAGVNGFATGNVPVTPDSALKGLSATNTNPALAAVNRSGGKWGTSGAGGSSAAGSHAGSGSAASASTETAKADKKEPKKWDFGSFFSSSSGGSSTGGKNSLNGNGLGEKKMESLNRKIASEQFAAEVSPASGKSNWEKVKRMYLLKEASLISGK